ncbi:MAG: hypothetical protein ACKOPQ_08695 [Novosphingobium sp.]
MTWNYRVLDHGTHLAVHEVYYDAEGHVRSWTAEPVGFLANLDEGLDGLLIDLGRVREAVLDKPVLSRADLPE